MTSNKKTSDTNKISDNNIYNLPILPLKGKIFFPREIELIHVGRDKSINALMDSNEKDKLIFLSAQKSVNVDIPIKKDIYEIGTIAKIIQLIKMPDGNIRCQLEGISRGKITKFISNKSFSRVVVEKIIEDVNYKTIEKRKLSQISKNIIKQFNEYVKHSNDVDGSILDIVTDTRNSIDLGFICDIITSTLGVKNIKIEVQQELLETIDIIKRAKLLSEILLEQIEYAKIDIEIENQTHINIKKLNKKMYLVEKKRTIQKELGKNIESEIDNLYKRIKAKKFPKDVEKVIKYEVKRLENMDRTNEIPVTRNYIDWLLDIPWEKQFTKDYIDIEKAEVILDEDHYAMEDPKDRIIEYLAVKKLNNKLKSPILCFVGAPGVGKTSLAKSIAKSMNRKFIKVSLGGVKDESEIRGHRKTYVGASPGRIIQGMKKAGSNNPVFLLDEIDKLGSGFMGNPSAALLEVLDPEQNKNYNDHYIEVDYDLSNVLFITTANLLANIPWELRDRMEIIPISSYTEHEKVEIAKRYLLPENIESHGLSPDNLMVNDDILLSIIRNYTKESGVRGLKKEIATLCRKIAKDIVKGDYENKDGITTNDIIKHLGISKYEYSEIEEENHIGCVNGLAWTELGGDLMNIEVSVLPGNGKLSITGNLGDVIKESARAAMSYVRSKSEQLELNKNFYKKTDIHIHMPDGATPKDGPSAGIAIATAIVSALTKKPVYKDIAMTGEITLRGNVLPIGGLREKSLGAHRGKIKKILIPQKNKKDIEKIPDEVKKDVEIITVTHMDEVIKYSIDKLQLDSVNNMDIDAVDNYNYTSPIT